MNTPKMLSAHPVPGGMSYMVSLIEERRGKQRKDVVTVLVHHNGARSTKSAISSTITPFHASRFVDRWLAADTIERESMR